MYTEGGVLFYINNKNFMENNNNLPAHLVKGNTTSLDDFKKSVRESVSQIFSLTSEKQHIPMEAFIENIDHGALHAFNVYKKAVEIADSIEKET